MKDDEKERKCIESDSGRKKEKKRSPPYPRFF